MFACRSLFETKKHVYSKQHRCCSDCYAPFSFARDFHTSRNVPVIYRKDESILQEQNKSNQKTLIQM